MSDVLSRICDDKRNHIAARKQVRGLGELSQATKAAPPPREFFSKLLAVHESGRHALIAEIKKASPSKGLIRENFDPVKIAHAYERGGAACLSVLTDEPYFQGENGHLTVARAAVSLPVLRKDFMLDPYQVVESRALGADCILLIMAILDDGQAAELEWLAQDLGMDVLVEVHDEAELERALALQSPLIGVNNRDLKTFKTNLATTENLAARLPRERFLVSESGLYTRADFERVAKAGACAFLVGESLMREEDVEAATKKLLGSGYNNDVKTENAGGD